MNLPIILTIVVLFLLSAFVLFTILRTIFARMFFWDSRLREISRQRMSEAEAKDFAIRKLRTF